MFKEINGVIRLGVSEGVDIPPDTRVGLYKSIRGEESLVRVGEVAEIYQAAQLLGGPGPIGPGKAFFEVKRVREPNPAATESIKTKQSKRYKLNLYRDSEKPIQIKFWPGS
jgi:hypothetical protein